MQNVQVFQRGPRVLAAALGATLMLALGIPQSAAADPPTAETIIISWAATSPTPPSPPFRGVGVGMFTASGPVSDAGTLTGTVQDVAVPSPNHATQHIVFTLNSDSGGTVTLRCTSIATDFSDLAAIPGSGTCAITGGGTGGGSGVWAGVQGQGTFSALTNGITRTQTATIELSIV
jgi:hypothetical protein